MRICAAQFQPIAGDIAKNIELHRSLIEQAVSQRADLVFFPELSLTGYEPALAKELATQPDDARWDLFQALSDAHGIIIGVGLPLLSDISAANERDAKQRVPGVLIGMIFFQPRQPRVWYAKQQLHSDELPFFIPGDKQLVLQADGHTLAPAICYESLQRDHAANATRCGVDIYLASVAKPDRGVVKAFAHYPEIAKQHSMTVLMANSIGPSDNFVSAGKSAAWNKRGELVSQLSGGDEGLLLFDTTSNSNRTDESAIRLRPVTENDLPTLYRNQLDPDAVRIAVVNPRDATEFDAHWSAILKDQTVTARAILANDELVGCISSFLADGQRCVGYWIAKEHWSRGIATRALALLLKEDKQRPLYARAASQNIGSIRVLIRNGFALTGRQLVPASERYPECEEVLLELK